MAEGPKWFRDVVPVFRIRKKESLEPIAIVERYHRFFLVLSQTVRPVEYCGAVLRRRYLNPHRFCNNRKSRRVMTSPFLTFRMVPMAPYQVGP